MPDSVRDTVPIRSLWRNPDVDARSFWTLHTAQRDDTVPKPVPSGEPPGIKTVRLLRATPCSALSAEAR